MNDGMIDDLIDDIVGLLLFDSSLWSSDGCQFDE